MRSDGVVIASIGSQNSAMHLTQDDEMVETLATGGEEYLSFPQRALFDRLGIRTMRIETDPFGNFLGQGYELGCARDWARLGNLYLQDGVWNDERILPAGYAKFVSTPAPAWVADKRPIYGAFFGSMVLTSIQSHDSPITWQVQAARLR
jgi:CubicO group peptidase (beta-lactamase class C family)